jgi:ech hydrogenase subunit B
MMISGIDDVYLFILFSLVLFVLAPFLGMFTMGLIRRMSARMQNRVGPPLMQPYYDVRKLLMKEETATNPMIGAWAFAFFLFNALGVIILVTLGDLLIVLVLLGFAQLALSLGGFASSSPYGHMGANRNLLQVLSVEPLLLMIPIAALLLNQNFLVKDLAVNSNMILYFPVGAAVVVFALVVWMQKGPFDLSTAHQEILYGNLAEFSGKNLALVELGHWFENFAFLALFSLFFNLTPLFNGLFGNLVLAVILDLVIKMLIAFIAVLVVTWIDNATTRVHWYMLPKFSFYVMWPLMVVNILFMYGFLSWGWHL